MSYRYMRVLVFFDLPMITVENKKSYRDFRKFLIKNGFFMVQHSVYSKLVPNGFAASAVINSIRKNKPQQGLVQVLKITEKQYAAIENIVGKPGSEIINSDERLIIL